MELNSTFVANVEKWQNNKKGLGFDLKITTKEKQIVPQFSNVEARYQKALYNLTNDIVKDAIKEIAKAYSDAITDVEEEKTLFREEINEYLDLFLQELFDYGIVGFCDIVEGYVFRYKLVKALKTAEYKSGEWVTWNGNTIAIDKLVV